MTTRHEHPLGFDLLWGWVAVLLLGGCQSPPANPGTPHASPSVNSPTATDVRTEANIIEMENRYIAEKNSQPTHQHEAEVEAEKKRKAAAAAKAAKEAAEQTEQAPKEQAPAATK